MVGRGGFTGDVGPRSNTVTSAIAASSCDSRAPAKPEPITAILGCRPVTKAYLYAQDRRRELQPSKIPSHSRSSRTISPGDERVTHTIAAWHTTVLFL